MQRGQPISTCSRAPSGQFDVRPLAHGRMLGAMVARWYTVGALCLLQLGCGSGENLRSTGTPGQQAPPAGQPPPQAPQLLSIAGRWGMFHFEDPVAVDIVENGTKLIGLGCDAGLPSTTTDRVVL